GILRLDERVSSGFLNGDGWIGIAVENAILKRRIPTVKHCTQAKNGDSQTGGGRMKSLRISML
ncbi:MAG: hypothetical protein IKS87_08795, partial [Lachnospiraceae bacterium]|nr:hypothetical protein [Lachnospiraceae bacterium]